MTIVKNFIQKFRLHIFIGGLICAVTVIFLLILFAGRKTYTVTFDLNGYYFKTGKTEAFDAVKDVEDLYTEYQKTEFDAFKEKFEEGGEFAGMLETSYISLVGKMTEKDEEAIAENWADSLLSEKEEDTDDNGLPTWAIVLIIVGGVLVVAGGAAAVVLYMKKKEAEAKRAEAIVNAYQRKKIDTTDDKTIDVYADEEKTEETVEETVEEVVEAVEETEEAPSEE